MNRIPERLSKIGRPLLRSAGPVVVGEMAAQAITGVPLVGAAVGGLVEGVAAHKLAVARFRKKPRPRWCGCPMNVTPKAKLHYAGSHCVVDLFRLSVENFYAYQRDHLVTVKEMLEQGRDPMEVKEQVDTLNIYDISSSDPDRWPFIFRGHHLPESQWPGEQIFDNPWSARRDQIEESLFRRKLRGDAEPVAYDYIERHTEGADPVGYHRLHMTETGEHGRMRVVMAAIHEVIQ